jgi:hypothetical protein
MRRCILGLSGKTVLYHEGLQVPENTAQTVCSSEFRHKMHSFSSYSYEAVENKKTPFCITVSSLDPSGPKSPSVNLPFSKVPSKPWFVKSSQGK